MGAALLLFLADEMWTEAKHIQDSTNDKTPEKENRKGGYKWKSDKNNTQSEIKDNTGKKGQHCFDDILVDCRGILFGEI